MSADAARPMGLEAAADNGDAGAEQRRGERVAGVAAIGASVEGEGDCASAVDRAAGRQAAAHRALSLRSDALRVNDVGDVVALHAERFAARRMAPDFGDAALQVALEIEIARPFGDRRGGAAGGAQRVGLAEEAKLRLVARSAEGAGEQLHRMIAL